MSIETLTTASPSLRSAVSTLYDAFASYRASDACSPMASITADEIRALHAKPLREVSGTDLSKFASKALTTWGDASDFRHFLPRLLELVAADSGWTDVPTLFGKLTAAEWHTWPEDEQRAVAGFVSALWSAVLRGEVETPLPGVALGASVAGIQLAPLLEEWRATSGSAPATHLAYLIGLERDSILRTGTVGRRWSQEAQGAFAALFRDAQTRRRLEETFFKISDKPDAETVSFALGVLEKIRRPEPAPLDG